MSSIRLRMSLLLALGSGLATLTVASGPAYRVLDVDPSFESTYPFAGCMVDAGSVAYFFHEGLQNGGEVWATDGTPQGTGLVVDIDPDDHTVFPFECPELMPPPVYNGLLYFLALDDQQPGLWRSDGTATGTFRLAEGGLPMLDVDGTIFFKGGDGELWKTDGWIAGTIRVRDILPGKTVTLLNGLIALDGIVYFFIDDGVHGMELWRSDGSEAGTTMVKDIHPSSDGTWYPDPVVVDGFLYFPADDGVNGSELWKSDGTSAGTTRVADIWPGPGSSAPVGLIAVGNQVLFGANDGGGRDLWRSDGTGTGTTFVRSGVWPAKDINGYFLEQAKIGNVAFFVSNGPSVWRSDGTPGGTAPLSYTGTSPSELTAHDGKLYFIAGGALQESSDLLSASPVPDTEGLFPGGLSSALGRLYFTMDGKFRRLEPSGTIVDLTGDEPAGSDPRDLTSAASRLVFSAEDPSRGRELWWTDGTAAGTEAFDLRPGVDGSYPQLLTTLGDTVFFRAADDDAGAEPWRSDGTASGTRRLADIVPGAGSSTPREFTVVGNRLFFEASAAGTGYELWTSDGTEAGTTLVKDILPGAGSSNTQRFFAWDEVLYFRADDGVNGEELWRSDGTAAGTVIVRDVFPGPGDASATPMGVAGTQLYFAADDGVHGRELWRTNGTSAGTVLVEDIAAGGSSDPVVLAVWNDTLYFSVRYATNQRSLWRSDGTPAGTWQLDDLVTADGPASNVGTPAVWNDALYFITTRPMPGLWGSKHELWVTDDTGPGTMIVEEIGGGLPETGPFEQTALLPLSGNLLFAADDGVNGPEPWATDGTGSGTLELADILEGARGSEPRSMTLGPTGDSIVFRAATLEAGYEPWLTDGTEAGTYLLTDVAPGPGSSLRDEPYFTNAANLTFFVAHDGTTGHELWATPAETPGAVPDGGGFFAGPPLRVEKLSGEDLRITWSAAACGPEAVDFALYEGMIGAFDGHMPVTCSTAGATQATISPGAAGNFYYLVVPQATTLEGSYGKLGDGIERPQSVAACRPRVIYDGCP